MKGFTEEEKIMLLLYGTGTLAGLTRALCEMKAELTAEENELKDLADSVLLKTKEMTEAEYQRFFDGKGGGE